MMDFQRIPESIWLLSDRTDKEQRARLLQQRTYEAIVRRVVEEAELLHYKRAQSKCRPGYYRVEILLTVSAGTVDIFHSSRCGYRAQYHHGVANGERANCYVVDELMPRLREMLSDAEKSTCRWPWAEDSLRDRFAKVWIHQGRWMTLAPRRYRNLCVQRWCAGFCSTEKAEMDRAVWASLTPTNERGLQVMGGWIGLDGTPLGESLKPARSEHLRGGGYT